MPAATSIPRPLNMNLRCQTCGIATSNRCTRCHKVAYCDGVCQGHDWPNHRDDCKDNQLGDALQRVAEIVHEAYLTFRENTWDITIDRVEVHDDSLTIHDGDLRPNTRCFTAFPNNLIGNNYEVKMAVLTAWMCNEPYAFLHNFIMKLVQGKFCHQLLAISTYTCQRPEHRHGRTQVSSQGSSMFHQCCVAELPSVVKLPRIHAPSTVHQVATSVQQSMGN